jgi:holliday junction DNA helicase RuvA
MIGRVAGILLEKNPPQILVDMGGVGYEIEVPMSTFYELPATGEPIVLRTHVLIREDAWLLYGFRAEEERAAFRQLVKVSGIGARTALALLSGLSVQELSEAVSMQDGSRLMKIPGIGKKTAERLLLELKDRFTGSLRLYSGHSAMEATLLPDPRTDILQALMALGYNEREAVAAMKGLPEDASVSDGIRQALKVLARA